MMGIDRVVARPHRLSLLAVACIAAPLLLPGCADVRMALGMDRVGPDEFAVEVSHEEDLLFDVNYIRSRVRLLPIDRFRVK